MSLESTLAAWQSPWLYGPAAAVLGLAVGSFLNVVIHRLPLMMERDWKEDVRAFFEEHKPSKAAKDLGAALAPDEPVSLVSPRSRCPACRHALSALENIPLASFAWQRGRCRHCGHAISWRYPGVEALTAGLFLLALLALGPNWQGLTALAFIALLVPLAAIDLDQQLLPDSLSLGLLWLGLLVNPMGVHAALEDAVLGAALGYLSLRAIQLLFRALRGFEGMGSGDAKLLAALGAWSGWQLLPLIAFLAAVRHGTPRRGAAETPLGASLRDLFGSAEKWIVAYDPDRQIAFFRALGIGATNWLTMLLVAGAALSLIVVAWSLSRHLRTRVRKDPVLVAYGRFTRALGTLGLPRAENECPRAYGRRVIESKPEIAAWVEDIVERYIELRYGGRSDTQALRDFDRQVKRFSAMV